MRRLIAVYGTLGLIGLLPLPDWQRPYAQHPPQHSLRRPTSASQVKVVCITPLTQRACG
jgi:hypothetical protein